METLREAYDKALREYEHWHAVWFNTSIYAPDYRVNMTIRDKKLEILQEARKNWQESQ